MRLSAARRRTAAAAVSNLQIIEELCRICEAQSHIIKAQADALAQMGAVVMEEERADVGRALTALIGHDEIPDEAEREAERIRQKQEREAAALAVAADGRW